MWLKHNGSMINLDTVRSFYHSYSYNRKPSLILYFIDDSEQYIEFDTEEERDMAYSAIIHALGSEVCVIDAE